MAAERPVSHEASRADALLGGIGITVAGDRRPARIPERPQDAVRQAQQGERGAGAVTTEEMTPREIVTALHDEIAARSPDGTALVAAYRQIPRPAPRPVRQPRSHPAYGPRYQRMTVYTQLRLKGHEPRAAARAAGVGASSASQYEADFLATLGGGI